MSLILFFPLHQSDWTWLLDQQSFFFFSISRTKNLSASDQGVRMNLMGLKFYTEVGPIHIFQSTTFPPPGGAPLIMANVGIESPRRDHPIYEILSQSNQVQERLNIWHISKEHRVDYKKREQHLRCHPSICSSLCCHYTPLALEPCNAKICHLYNLDRTTWVITPKQSCSTFLLAYRNVSYVHILSLQISWGACKKFILQNYII